MYPRNLKAEILESAVYSPVIVVNGARQVGKSTLMAGLFENAGRPTYIDLDDVATLAAAKAAPKNFVQGLKGPIVIDEVQRAPELFLPIKEIADASGKKCRFFLTGSAGVLGLSKLADSLAGRMEVFSLWPLSQGELRGKKDSLVDLLFRDRQSLPQVDALELPELLSIMTVGGYPEVLNRPSPKARFRWFRGYINSILERDIRDLSRIEGITELPNLLALLASRAGCLLNHADLSRSMGMPHMTLKRYMALLEAVFFVVQVQPWSRNIGKRLLKTPKVFINDTGLMCHLLGRDIAALNADRTLLGSVFENFVCMELVKQLTWADVQPRLYHFRTADNRFEVDFVLEAPDGRIVAIECKASSSVDEGSFKGLRYLKEQTGAQFHRGIVLYTGEYTLTFGADLQAVPVSALWETATEDALALSL